MDINICSVRIIRIIHLGKNSRILTNFIMDMNIWNNYDLLFLNVYLSQ